VELRARISHAIPQHVFLFQKCVHLCQRCNAHASSMLRHTLCDYLRAALYNEREEMQYVGYARNMVQSVRVSARSLMYR
jgi:hypothetical protein